jgi:short-subunit dehydrogenase
MTMRAIITGATSGIGAELAKQLSSKGWEVGITGRREELLAEVASSLGTKSWTKIMDVTSPELARQAMADLLAEMGEVDLVILNAGMGGQNPKLAWEHEELVVRTNVLGFVATALEASSYFKAQGRGHLVGMSSVAGVRGMGAAPAYAASKAFVSSYMEGLRHNFARLGLDIQTTDLRPGFVDTPLTSGQRGMFWLASVEVAGEQIIRAIERRKKKVYVTRRWCLVAGIMRVLPDFIFHKI